MNYEYQEAYEFQPEYEYEYEGEFNHEMHEDELANELMNIQSEEELEYFLGNLLKGAWRGAKALYNSPVGQQLKGHAIAGLKSLGKRALPGLGSAVGRRFFGARGGQIGGKLGNMAARGLGLEFEGASPVDRRFEGSKRLIRLAKTASKRIAAYARSGKPVSARVIRTIILREGQRWFPNLPSTGMSGSGGGSQTAGYYPSSSSVQDRGTWYRQGNQIIIQGA